MDRMLRGQPTITRPGLLTKAGLAREAQVDRNHITQGSCSDLGDRFSALAAQQDEPRTAREAQQQQRVQNLTSQLERLEHTQAALRAERDKWQASTHTLLRAIQVLRLESTALQSEVDVLTKRLNATADTTAAGLYIVGPSERHTPPKPESPR